jgi:hypothetical protein
VKSLQKFLAHWISKGEPFQTALTSHAYPYVLTLGVSVLFYQIVHQFMSHDMAFIYLEYLSNYDMGFIRRGLVPELLSHIKPQLTHLDVRIFAAIAIALALAAYITMFAARFGLTARELPLLTCTIVSPCIFKNFAFDLGRLDIFGFMGAIVALSLPVNRIFSIALGAMCCVLGLIHEAQFLLYIPVIATIAALRLLVHPDYFRKYLPWREAITGLAIIVTVATVIVFGAAKVPPDVFLHHIQTRASDPVIDRIFIWYSGVSDIALHASQPHLLWQQLLRSPKYLLIFLAHAPLLWLGRLHVKAMPFSAKAASALGLAALTLGFITLFAISHDKARWFANWLTCVILLVHAVRMTHPGADLAQDTLRTPLALVAAWTLAVLPRVGLFAP